MTENRQASRAGGIAGAVLVLVGGGFVVLALIWFGSWNGEWEHTASDRRKIFTAAAVAFACTVGMAATILWRTMRRRPLRATTPKPTPPKDDRPWIT